MGSSSSEQVIADLRKSLAWLDLVLATLNEGVVVLNGNMEVLFANDALADMLGKPRVLLLGASVWDILQLRTEDKILAKPEYKKVQQKDIVKSLSGVFQLWTENSIINIESSAEHIENTSHTVLVIRDVTERLQAQTQRVKIAQERAAREAAQISEQRVLIQYKVASILAESQKQEVAITEILKIVGKGLGWKAGVIWTLDTKKAKLQYASSWTDGTPQLRYFISDSRQKTFLKNEGLPGRVWKKLESQWENDVAASEDFPRKESARKAGLHGAFAIPLLSGKEFVGIMEFFSDRVQKPDKELLTSMTTVGMQTAEYMRRKSVERLTSSLREQKAYLLELNKAKDEFISVASHQLRTPATVVKQFLGMMMEGYCGDLTEAQKEFAEIAYESNERQIVIVNDLLRVAQVDAGKVILKQQEIDLDKLLRSILREQKAKFAERQQTLSYVNKFGPIVAPIDITHFRMALENIIDNASKYTELGENTTITLYKNDTSAIISVQDKGIGIAKDDIDKIFHKFTRIDNPMSVLVGGSGLGLYWCKKIIELHEGSISVASVVGKGTTFTIYVPIK